MVLKLRSVTACATYRGLAKVKSRSYFLLPSPYLNKIKSPPQDIPRRTLSTSCFDCYLCPQNQILKYTTTNREGYREYKSDPRVCQNCPCRENCTLSKNKTKVVIRHVWAKYMEEAEHMRHSSQIRDTYKKPKETIERVFAEAKERHCLRYTNYRGLVKVKVQVALIFSCLNLKKLAKRKLRIFIIFFYLRRP